LHPDYRSREIAVASGLPLTSIQHHRAHLHAVLAENPDVGRPLLAAIWDGTGYGEDGTIWGGEFFVCDAGDERRVACLRPFQLPGGEQSIRQPRRIALSLLYGLLGESAEHHPALPDFMEGEIRVLLRMLQQNIHSPLCSSMGRLFDGVAALLGIHPRSDYEGEAAVCLEQLASRYPDILQLSPYPLALDRSTSPWQLDWRPMLRELLDEAATGGVPCALPAARFHLSLAHAILNVADALGITQLLVGGGCWQNRLLLETLVALAGKRDMQVCWPRSLPPGDGGIAVGQLVAAHCAVE
jgi:hydrogenase maturation protein HypF